MSKITVPKDTVTLEVDGEDKEVSLLSLYYTMVGAIEGFEEAPLKEKSYRMAAAINEEFSCNISWGQAAHLLSQLTKMVDDLKKNTTQEQE